MKLFYVIKNFLNKKIVFILSVVILLICGLVYIPTAIWKFEPHSVSSPATGYLTKQFFYVVIGLMGSVFLSRTDYKILKKYSYILLGLGLVLLSLTIFPWFGQPYGGTSRWLGFGPVGIMPAELIKFLLVILTAKLLEEAEYNRKSLLTMVPLLIIITVILFLQPDIVNLIIINLVVITMISFSGRKILSIWLRLILFISLLCFFLVFPYRLEKIIGFFNPIFTGFYSEEYSQTYGYQTIQSINVIYGEVTNLPDAHSGFIFSVITHELGLIKTLLVIGLIFYVITYFFYVAKKSNDEFGFHLSYGLGLLMLFQSVLHISICLGLLPATNVLLPFISYYGTTQVFYIAAIGIVLNISQHGIVSLDRRNKTVRDTIIFALIIFLTFLIRLFQIKFLLIK